MLETGLEFRSRLLLSLVHLLKLLGTLLDIWSSCGWWSHQKPPSPNNHSSECSIFWLSELTDSVTNCGYLLTWLCCNRQQPKWRINSFHRNCHWAVSPRIYFSITFPHYLCIQIKWTGKATCNNAQLITCQISPKSSFGCPVFQSSAGNGCVREHERPVLVWNKTVALMHTHISKTIETPF